MDSFKIAAVSCEVNETVNKLMTITAMLMMTDDDDDDDDGLLPW